MFSLLLAFLVSCTGNTVSPEVEPKVNIFKTESVVTPSAANIQPSITSTLTETVIPEISATAPVLTPQICALFEGEGLENLMQRLTNPFYRPEPGSDDPHQGVDFSDLDPDNRIALSGKPVQAIIQGKVAMVITERFPYGNAVLIETAFDDLPTTWQERIDLSIPVEREIFHSNLTCTGKWEEAGGDVHIPSFYILYAHFEEALPYQIGDRIDCGQEIGKIGMSGNALAPHVHVEMRLGPGGVIFEDMAHYDSSASLLAMENYCRWRVSGWYHLLDPMIFLLIQ